VNPSARLLLLLFALAIPLNAVGVEIVDRIVVVVNDDLILESEVAEELDLYLEAGFLGHAPDVLAGGYGLHVDLDRECAGLDGLPGQDDRLGA